MQVYIDRSDMMITHHIYNKLWPQLYQYVDMQIK